MVSTRRQSVTNEKEPSPSPQHTKPSSSRKKASPVSKRQPAKKTKDTTGEAEVGDKRGVEEAQEQDEKEGEGPPAKKVKDGEKEGTEKDHPAKHVFQEGELSINVLICTV